MLAHDKSALCSLLFFGLSSLVGYIVTRPACILSDSFLTHHNNAYMDYSPYGNGCACLIEAVKTLVMPTFLSLGNLPAGTF